MERIPLFEILQNNCKTSTQTRPNFVFIPLNEGKPSQKGYLIKTNNFLMVYRVVNELLFGTEMIGRLLDSM